MTLLPRPGADGTRSVLVVCTGNICRSPAAELLLRASLPENSGIAVASAGLGARVGEPVAPPMARLLHGRDVGTDGFTARQLDPLHVTGADLVLTMTAEQRAAVVTQVPLAVRRTFTLLEFAELAALIDVGPATQGPAARLDELVRAAPRARARRAAARVDDVEDPYRQADEVFARAFAAVERAVEELLLALGEPPEPRSPGGTSGLPPLSEIGPGTATESSDRWSTRHGAIVVRHGGGSS